MSQDFPPNTEPDLTPPGNDESNAAPAPTARPSTARKRRPLVWLAAIIGTLVLTLLGALAGLWIWTGREGSLAQAISLAQRIPAVGEALMVSDVQGSVRQGGHIGSLRWQQDGLTVEGEGLAAHWELAPLLSRRVAIDRLSAQRLAIIDHRPPQPSTPPGDLGLPVTIEPLHWNIQTLTWGEAAEAIELTQVGGVYSYDEGKHALDLTQLRFGEGRYSGAATLSSTAPHQLEANLEGDIATGVPGSDRTAQINATAHVRGPLTRLSVDARAATVSSTGSKPDSSDPQASVQATVAPWAAQPVPDAQLRLGNFDAAVFWPQAPSTRLSGEARIEPAPGAGDAAWNISAHVTNARPGVWDKGLLPVSGLDASLQWRNGAVRIDQLVTRIGAGTLSARGQWAGEAPAGPSAPANAWQLVAHIAGVDPARIHSAFASSLISGKAQAAEQQDGIHFGADLAGAGTAPVAGIRLRTIKVEGVWHEGLLQLPLVQIQAADARVLGKSVVYDTRAQRASGNLELAAPGMGLKAVARNFGESAGDANSQLDLRDAQAFLRWVRTLPGLPGTLGEYRATGNATLQATVREGWRNPQIDASLRVPDLSLSRTTAGNREEPLTHVTDTTASIHGRLANATLDARIGASVGERRVLMTLGAQGGLHGESWLANMRSLHAEMVEPAPSGGTRRWQIESRQSFSLRWVPQRKMLSVSPGELDLTAPVARNATARVSWTETQWQPGRLLTGGRIDGVPLTWLDAIGGARIADLNIRGDLVLDGQWHVNIGSTLDVDAQLTRRSGDLLLTSESSPMTGATPPLTAGLRDARLRITSSGSELRAHVVWDSERAGTIQGDVATRLRPEGGGWSIDATAPLSGHVTARLPSIGVWSALAPLGWRIGGSIALETTIGGTIDRPTLQGQLNADQLMLRSVLDGIEFGNGRLRSTFSGEHMQINEFVLHGQGTNGGTLVASGSLDWANGSPRADMAITATKLRASVRSDRRLVASGNARIVLADGRATLTGNLTADEALIILPDESTPSLGDDVVVINRKRPRAGEREADTKNASTEQAPSGQSAPGIIPVVDLQLDLGQDFRVQGHGIQTGLRGKLRLTAQGSAAPQLNGEIQTWRGRYRAYGQNLDIETGIIRFAGPYGNPSLDILAIRPNLTERVGVKIDGTAQSPRIQLYSASGLSASETLSWLVLGRSGANGGAEAALLQQAAMALLSGSGPGLTGQIAQAFGLDEISIGGSASGSTDDSDTATGAAITVSKRFARNFYVSYERSLTGALGTLYVFYEISRRLTLRAQSGETTAVDLIYTFSFDGK